MRNVVVVDNLKTCIIKEIYVNPGQTIDEVLVRRNNVYGPKSNI